MESLMHDKLYIFNLINSQLYFNLRIVKKSGDLDGT